MLTLIFEAAFRSLLMAVAVWAGIRMLRVQAVLAQKVAWVLVLAAAGIMPLLMHSPWLALNRALQIPIHSPRLAVQPIQKAAVAAQPDVRKWVSSAKRAAIHLSSSELASAEITLVERAAMPASLLPGKRWHSSASNHTAPETRKNTGVTQASIGPLATSPATPAPSAKAAARSNWSSWLSWTRIRQMLIIAYIAVGAFLLLRTLAGLGIAFRIWRRSEPIADLGNEVLAAVGGQSLQARVSRHLMTPVTIGSTVILPADYPQWDAEKLRIVLAHEQSHVRQRDFYLQSLAALHAAVFWFSPLGWWLKRKLSELGEALSDRAGLEQASNPSSYAQILLEFAAIPRITPYAGVAMASSSNLSSRIERILNDRRFRLAFFGGRRHAILAAALVPVALVAAVAGIRIEPSVEAAQDQSAKTIKGQTSAPVTGLISNGDVTYKVLEPKTVADGTVVNPGDEQITGQVSGQVSGQIAGDDQVVNVESGQDVAPAAPTAPPPAAISIQAPETPAAPSADTIVAPVPPAPPAGKRHASTYIHSDDDEGGFAIVHENGDGTLRWNGEYNDDLAKVRRKMNLHGDYVWFERDGKSYVITDPAFVVQAQTLFKGDPQLDRQMAELERQQAVLEKKMDTIGPEMEKIGPGPDFQAAMAKLQLQLAELQNNKVLKMTADMSQESAQEKLSQLQERMGEIQNQLGELQGKIGERQGEIGEKQGQIGEEMGKIGEQMGRIGEEQGRRAEEASRKFRSVLDQAFKDGKAKPVE